ncbi:amidohydrolase family protein [Chitinophaga horti]|uniref:Amidohydrolase family protein n=1 Tax=Chitinophaga horti TaxID=2920382 RepID=A0ABY6J7V3_9BACT|nr:amidohydrolase family protein [Chitinophaga horti]UYQ95560.1 amidohydrolase family protein [Chitinophaga horti]
MMLIDTHVHVWNLSRAEYPWLQGDTSILNRSWQIEELDPADAGVTAGVLVQAAGNLEDTALMLETARNTPWIKGVVAWLPLTDTRRTADLLQGAFLSEPCFKGVRHQIHDEPDAQWLLQPTVLESLQLLADHDIPYDLVGILPAHIETALKVAEQVPALRMVFDHLNQPPIATRERFGKWGELMKEASAHPNFYAKISGLGTASGSFAGRTAADIQPYVDFAIEHFGVARCFCGGDWPVSMLANGYAQTWSMIRQALSGLSTPEQEQVLGSNAVRFYNLNQPAWK